MDIQKIIEDMARIARENLNKDNHLTPIALIFKEGALISSMIISWDTDENKQYAYRMLGEKAKELAADFVIWINDVAVRTVKSPEELEFIKKNYDTERPTAYPETLRQDMILLGYLDLKTLKDSMWIQAYNKMKDGKRVYKELIKTENMVSAMSQWIIEGTRR